MENVDEIPENLNIQTRMFYPPVLTNNDENIIESSKESEDEIGNDE